MKSSDYDFELPRIYEFLQNSKVVALQFPEGLLSFAEEIALKIEDQLDILTIVIADVAYGACNADFSLIKEMQCDSFIHFGHSELVKGYLPSLYIPCKRTDSDVVQLCQKVNNYCEENNYKNIALTTTSQTFHFLPEMLKLLKQNITFSDFPALNKSETLGCTCKTFGSVDAIFSIVDGIFHAEGAVAMNKNIPVFRVDPRSLEIDREGQDVEARLEKREQLVDKIRGLQDSICFVLGTMGGQGSITLLQKYVKLAEQKFRKVYKMMVPEVYPQALNIPKCQIYVQMACPRLTIDWGEYYGNVINTVEFEKLLCPDIEDYPFLNFCGTKEVGSHLNTWNQ
ncbi:Diphthamide biosynthesis protein [Spironucleus salmonicida]|uniref:2-(3-amino-3-carboxypropyl)histidine synthase subunit 1 n=1 Tax=Spironucleus salmonicida TaxID=348837 RepID=V6M2J8_9EUKA|nr:Diphthamide biosynthesis protein [Spironucleus salmonicida]|eukprot:EST47479.1 Diphthamide biosynthesis protein [Spironucleus salmonicida]